MAEELRDYLANSEYSNDGLDQLAIQAQNGCVVSREKIIRTKAHVAVSLLKRYNYSPNDAEYYDQLQECVITLNASIDDFDATRGDFFSYMYWRVRYKLLNGMKKDIEKKRCEVFENCFEGDSIEPVEIIDNTHSGLNEQESLVYDFEMKSINDKACSILKQALVDEVIPSNERELMELVVDTIFSQGERHVSSAINQKTGMTRGTVLKKHCYAQFRSYLKAHGSSLDNAIRALFQLT